MINDNGQLKVPVQLDIHPIEHAKVTQLKGDSRRLMVQTEGTGDSRRLMVQTEGTGDS